ncbi:Holliday junction resolvase RecU [Paenibacillus elgii]|uniref:hypothetical protein n=1 Tax=Paenibacillus elgii TaxID=189691 RepID=UPI002D7AC99E|nr:Holliday junction resolvase RecU [Paenibacillus elgii]
MISKTSEGKRFEENWKNSYKDLPIYYLRLRDAAKWNRGTKSTFTPENPYDCLQFSPPFLWLLELKSTKDASISFNPIKPYETPKNDKTKVMIKHNQVIALMEAATKDGVIAGFVLNFRERNLKTKSEPNIVYFIHINDFLKFAEESKKSTINREDCESFGIQIKYIKKKVNYTYLISEFVETTSEVYLRKNYIDILNLKKAHKWIGDLIRKCTN